MKQLLQHSGIDFSRLPQSVILESGNEQSRLRAAELLAAAAQCTQADAPCLECAVCRKVLARNHPDVKIISPLKDRTTVSVSQAREVRSDAYIKAHEGRSKVYLFDQAQALTPEAQNAMLKVIEEPPSGSLFVFCLPAAGALLETIRSRSNTIALPAEEEQKAKGVREKLEDAVTLLTDAVIARGEAGQMAALIPLEKDRQRMLDAMELIGLVLRDAVALGVGQPLVSGMPQAAQRLGSALQKDILIRLRCCISPLRDYLELNGKPSLATAKLAGDFMKILYN